MIRVLAILFCLFFSSKIFSQSCPSLIYPLNGSSNIPVNATISWNDVVGVTGYIIAIGTVSGGNDIIQSQTSINSFSPPLGLPDNTQIYVTITLFFFNLPNIQCPSHSFRTEDIITPPACAFLLNPLDGATNVNVGANISWAYVKGADGYFLSIGTSSGIGDIINNFDVGNTLQFNPIINFPPSTEIFVKVVPYNENGISNTCIEAHFRTGDIAALPICSYLISPLNGETNVPLSPLIIWESTLGATGYKVFIGSSPFENDVLDGGTFFANSTFVFNFLPNNIYFIRIIPFNESGEALSCIQETFSTVLGCGPFYDPITGNLRTINPEINFPDQISICENQIPKAIASNDIADGYRWYFINNDGTENLISNQSDVNISEVGNYRYEAYNLSPDKDLGMECSTIKEFKVVSSNPPEINSITINENNNGFYIDVQVSGIGPYEYSISSAFGPYQDSNIFTNAPEDTSIIYVRDKNGCGILEFKINNTNGFPKYFTPNADGIHDIWQYSRKKDNDFILSSISIYDRYGKLIKQFHPYTQGWDGTINGELMPTSDYWYTAVTTKGEVFSGHFTLRR